MHSRSTSGLDLVQALVSSIGPSVACLQWNATSPALFFLYIHNRLACRCHPAGAIHGCYERGFSGSSGLVVRPELRRSARTESIGRSINSATTGMYVAKGKFSPSMLAHSGPLILNCNHPYSKLHAHGRGRITLSQSLPYSSFVICLPGFSCGMEVPYINLVVHIPHSRPP